MSGTSLAEKNSAIGDKWAELSKEDKEVFQKQAKNLTDPEDLTSQQKDQVVKKHLKQLTKEVSIDILHEIVT